MIRMHEWECISDEGKVFWCIGCGAIKEWAWTENSDVPIRYPHYDFLTVNGQVVGCGDGKDP